MDEQVGTATMSFARTKKARNNKLTVLDKLKFIGPDDPPEYLISGIPGTCAAICAYLRMLRFHIIKSLIHAISVWA